MVRPEAVSPMVNSSRDVEYILSSSRVELWAELLPEKTVLEKSRESQVPSLWGRPNTGPSEKGSWNSVRGGKQSPTRSPLCPCFSLAQLQTRVSPHSAELLMR